MAANFMETLTGGPTVYIRPIRRDDVERERQFVDGLSAQSRYNRFLAGVSHLTQGELESFCDVDQHRNMAFVALDQSGSEDIQVGVARYVANGEQANAEIAVTIADDWQGKGLDDVLLQHLIDFARDNAVESLYSIELASNTAMRALARRFGFDSSRDLGDPGQIVYRLQLVTKA